MNKSLLSKMERETNNLISKFKALFKPDQTATDIQSIDFEVLKQKGITTLLLDIDDTLISRKVHDVYPSVLQWITARKEEGFKICLTSNSRHPMRVKHIAETLEVPSIHFGMKPLPFAFWRALKMVDAKAEEAAMIGDQLFMDVLGGNLVKLYTIYVKHLTPETFLPRVWMRAAEEWAINNL